MKEQPLGFNKDQQIVIPFRSVEARQAYTALKNELLQNSQITAASGTAYYPGILNPSDMSVYLPGQSVNNDNLVKTNWVTPDFMETMGFKVVAGRMLSNEFPADTNYKMVVNEATLRKFGIPLEKAVGQRFLFNGGGDTPGSIEVVGRCKGLSFPGFAQSHRALCILP